MWQKIFTIALVFWKHYFLQFHSVPSQLHWSFSICMCAHTHTRTQSSYTLTAVRFLLLFSSKFQWYKHTVVTLTLNLMLCAINVSFAMFSFLILSSLLITPGYCLLHCSILKKAFEENRFIVLVKNNIHAYYKRFNW